MPSSYDAIVIGGGHNGLVAAAYLGRAGLRTVVLERRSQVGGAAITETPWGPDYKVSMLSYVVSLLSPQVIKDLRLEKFGYKVYPQGPYFVPYADGRYLQISTDPKRRYEQIAKFSERDANAYEEWDQWLQGSAEVLRPLLHAIAPKLGSRSPKDVRGQLQLAWQMRNLGVRGVRDITRLFSMSIADLLEDYFESQEMRSLLSASGVIGAWAGPRSPGTAFVMLHHKIGEAVPGQFGTWGFAEGGMGGISQAIAQSAESFGVEIRKDVTVSRISIRNGYVTGVVLENGDELQAQTVVAAVHPKTAFLDMMDRADLPSEFVTDIERWNTRSGTVKINLAVDKLPEFTSKPGFDPEVHGGTIVLTRSLDELESAFQDAVNGSAARRPFADICIPSVFDKTLAPEGQHIVSMFTQWVPHTWSDEPHEDELQAYADRMIALVEEVAPGFTNSILHKRVVGPYEMEQEYGLIGGNIFHGELSTDQLFHMRPVAGYSDFHTPINGLYQASSATHGGGGVTGIPGMNAVRQILRDRR